MNQAIEALPKHIKKTYFVSASGLTHKGDDTHFNTASARILGKRYAEIYQKILRGYHNGK